MPVSNQVVSEILSEIGQYLEMQKVAFKPRVYEKVAVTISELQEDLSEIYRRHGLKGLEEIPGVGISIAEKIEELLKTGHLKYYQDLKKKFPVNISELTRIGGLGPESVKKLYQKLNIRNLRDLEKAAKAGKIAGLADFGEKTQENILKGIEFLRKAGGRFILGLFMPEIRILEGRLRQLKGVEQAIVAGSVRRRKETIGDIDILVTVKTPGQSRAAKATAEKVMDYFISMPEVIHVYAHGPTKSAIKLKSGLDVDLRVLPPESYGAALNYFTGSKTHNVALREIAIKKGYKLNEYGLFKVKKGKVEKRVGGKTEVELYQALGMSYVEPEMRENNGELELAKNNKLPKLINYGDLQGDLQVQTDWTDGSASIETMAKTAAGQGLKYIVITDHTKRLAMTNGLDERRIKKQWLEIDRVNKKLQTTNYKIRILKGSECDILKDGSLDLPDEILEKLDVVGGSVHSYFNLSRAEQTDRIKKAMANPNVDIIFHPTGRIIQRREAYEVDMEELIEVAKKTKTVMEINAFPDRLDLKDEYIRKCIELGVKLAIDSDAHTPNHFIYLEHGIAQARRGWARRSDIVNAWPVEKMLEFLK